MKFSMKSFAQYKKDAPNQITMANGAFYPDILKQAYELYKPVLIYFGQLLATSASSEILLKEINISIEEKNTEVISKPEYIQPKYQIFEEI